MKVLVLPEVRQYLKEVHFVLLSTCTIFAAFIQINVIIMKRILHGIINYRVCALLMGSMLLFMMSGCDEMVEEPIPTLEMHKGYSTQLNALSDNVKWGSSDPSIATVSSTGLVTAVKAGKATIYTYSSNDQQEVACYLEVHPTRNILFYIGGDNNLFGEAYTKINKVRSGWQPGMGEMIIYVDHEVDGACLLRITEVKGNEYFRLDTIQDYGAENSADHTVLSGAINRMKQDYPADSYGMILFSHASGWLPEGMLASPRSIVRDDAVVREMEYYDFAAAIPDKQFDFIIIEACLMADVMSMYELRNKAEYVLASSAEIVSPAEYVLASSAEIVSPGFTNIYDKKIMGLYDTKNNVSTILSGFVQSYYDIMKNSITMSLIKMDEMENLASVTKSILKGIDIDDTNLDVDEIQTFDRPRALGGRPYSRYFDFAHIMENLVSSSDYKIFNTQMEKTVIWKASSSSFLLNQNGFYINHHCGLTTYIEQTVYPELKAAYRNSSWYKAVYN